jgi:hypothetical protein
MAFGPREQTGMFDEITLNTRHANTDPLLPMIAEHERLLALCEDAERRAKEIKSTLPKDVVEGKASITVFIGFDKPHIFHFKTEREAENFAKSLRVLLWAREHERPSAEHWDRIVTQLVSDFRTARKAQIEDVLEASGCAALEREAEALDEEVYELRVKILATPARSLSALFYQLELARPEVDYEGLVDTIIAGVKRLAAGGAA